MPQSWHPAQYLARNRHLINAWWISFHSQSPCTQVYLSFFPIWPCFPSRPAPSTLVSVLTLHPSWNRFSFSFLKKHCIVSFRTSFPSSLWNNVLSTKLWRNEIRLYWLILYKCLSLPVEYMIINNGPMCYGILVTWVSHSSHIMNLDHEIICGLFQYLFNCSLDKYILSDYWLLHILSGDGIQQ